LVKIFLEFNTLTPCPSPTHPSWERGTFKLNNHVPFSHDRDACPAVCGRRRAGDEGTKKLWQNKNTPKW